MPCRTAVATTGDSLNTLSVNVPDEMEDRLQDVLKEHPHSLNTSELVRDALRHLIESQRLSGRTREDIRVSCEQIEAGNTVALNDLE